ncbi:nucleotidyltransferase domain-containing protein [Demequina soli]|uniref:nucleotidyltransferase domain-containing protein n=1 Tax=Demequina soli TaxID=1638987 RepID=UPI0007826A56|nr:nucleotidyltransferase [Demequina soli]
MAKTVPEAFATYLGWITPTDAARAKASAHRASIEAKLKSTFGVWRMYESGSWRHGTGVGGHSDVDYFISLRTDKPAYGSTVLGQVRAAMQERFPQTHVHVQRPAVVLEFGGGYERVELIPAFPEQKLASGAMLYAIPGVADEWMQSAPEAHLNYVDVANNRDEVKRGAKGLARLAKSWKYECNVPISSFYLEMRAAQYMNGERSVVWDMDLQRFLASLSSHDLADMNDPTGSSGRIKPCSSSATHRDALSKLRTAAVRADKAVAARESDPRAALGWWDYIFGGKFPGYY